MKVMDLIRIVLNEIDCINDEFVYETMTIQKVLQISASQRQNNIGRGLDAQLN